MPFGPLSLARLRMRWNRNKHRLAVEANVNRGGDRQANAALYRIVVVRLRYELRTQAYMRRRTAEGMSKREVIRCLKRYVAREVYSAIQKPAKILDPDPPLSC